jgi:N-acetylglucosaminyl-diphospho-decaprenol L-rhamnosyltransferase
MSKVRKMHDAMDTSDRVRDTQKTNTGETIDVIVVSYNSREHLRACVEPLASLGNVNVVVVDNASPDGSLDAVHGLPLTAIQNERNGGFAYGCNTGWRAGRAPNVLFLNPDARVDASALDALTAPFENDDRLGAVAPRIVHEDGSLDFSQRRYPRLRSTYAQALFLHRLFPHASWTDEVVRDDEQYVRQGSPDWVSGAAVMVRRSVLEELGGFDERFFMYCEDTDLCKRVWDLGREIRYQPDATVMHVGGGSAPRASLLPVLATSRIRYARKHRSAVYAVLERVGVALGALTHMAVSRGGRAARAGHARSLRVAVSKSPS